MAFELKDTNGNGIAVITDPDSSLVAMPQNFIDKYTLANKYQPQLLKELSYAHGKGNITGVLEAISGGKTKTYASDMIQWAEMGRLHNKLEGVTIEDNAFTCAKPHQLRVKDRIKISDGDKEWQATVSRIVSATVFEALNDGLTAFPTDPVTVLADFSSSFQKGDDGFQIGKGWDPRIRNNFSHIIGEHYEIADSDLKHITWISTPDGPMWYHTEIERIHTLFRNKEEITIMFNERSDEASASAQAGYAPGQIGVVPFVERYGNVSNELITSIQDLSDIAFRAKQQGVCREFMMFCDHQQLSAISDLAAGLNASYVNGRFYGSFQNSKDMAQYLDFSHIYKDGIQYHFKDWAITDDPTLLGSTKFDTTSLSYLGVPTGNKVDIKENGSVVSVPYLEVLYRGMDRKRQMKGWGVFGTQTKRDSSSIDLLTECTNRLVGANNFFVGRKNTFYV